MSVELNIESLLISEFNKKHVVSFLRHYKGATDAYTQGDWERVGEKSGKFVEAVTKALMLKCNLEIPNGKHFKAGVQLKNLEKTPKTVASDDIRLLIPKACLFIYDVASNRGGRHDSNEIDPNEMDANTLIPLMSWILSDLLRISKGEKDNEFCLALIKKLTRKKFPFFENIDGKIYINQKVSAPECCFLLLYNEYPKRVLRKDLIDSLIRNGIKKEAARITLSRQKDFFDENDFGLVLRSHGCKKAEELIHKYEV